MKPLDYTRPANSYGDGWTPGWIAAWLLVALAWAAVLALAVHELLFIACTDAVVHALVALLEALR